MLGQANFIVFVLFEIASACIPTQQVETTTTTTTTTTEAPDPATPCVTCQKVYDKTCVGYVAGSAWCSAASSVTITYEIGAIALDYAQSNIDYAACIISFTCPSGTTVVVDAYGTTAPEDPFGYNAGYCQESGANAGQWYWGAYGLTEFDPVAMRSLKCAG